jgi:hypothetical protein
VVCALAVTLACAAAHAEEDKDGPQSKAAARDLARQGDELMARGDCVGALDRFGRAYAIVPAPTISILEARCLVKLGRFGEAADKYEQTQRTRLHAASPKPFWVAVGDAERELKALRARIPRLRISVSGVPANATDLRVELDGAIVPPSLLGVEQPVNPGDHVVTATRGKDVKRASVALGAGEARVVELQFEPTAQLEPAPIAPPPAAPPPAAPAPHAHFDSASTSQRTWGWSLLGVGAAGIVAGGVTGAIALDKKSTLDEVCTPACPRGSEDDIDTFRTMRTVSWIGFGVGVAGVGVGLALLATSGGREPALDAWIGPGLTGVRGAF